MPFECENTDGSYICECTAGYERDQGDICRNIDECERNELTEIELCPEKGKGFTETFKICPLESVVKQCYQVSSLWSYKRGNLLRYRRFI